MQNKLKALLVDDEELIRCTLHDLINEYCSSIEVIATASSARTARSVLEAGQADVLFLDIQMPGGTGFDLLKEINTENLLCVFVTAFEEYAVPAFKVNAVDYLLKPVKISELKRTEQRLVERHRLQSVDRQNREICSGYIERLLESVHPMGGRSRRVTLSHSKGFNVVDMDDIVRLEAERNYTRVYLRSQEYILVARTLTDFENILDADSFARVHKSHVVNLLHLNRYINEDCGYVVMSDGKRIEISRRRMPELFSKIKQYTRCIRK